MIIYFINITRKWYLLVNRSQEKLKYNFAKLTPQINFDYFCHNLMHDFD